MSLTAVWRRDDGVEVPADVVAWNSPEIDVWMDREHQRFDRSGFTATVEVAALAGADQIDGEASKGAGAADWSLVLRRHVADISREGTLRSRHAASGEPASLPAGAAAGHRVDSRFDPRRGGLIVTVA
jgi:hypothetical protein